MQVEVGLGDVRYDGNENSTAEVSLLEVTLEGTLNILCSVLGRCGSVRRCGVCSIGWMVSARPTTKRRCVNGTVECVMSLSGGGRCAALRRSVLQPSPLHLSVLFACGVRYIVRWEV